jgi:hypothetical protein
MAILRPLPPQSLADRIAAVRAEIETYIDQRVEAERIANPGIPTGVIRNLLTARSGGCQCEAYLSLVKEPGA